MEESSYLKDPKDLITKLKRVPFLKSIDLEHLKEILKLSKIRKYKPDEIITKEGEYDCWIYVIISGAVKVVKGGNEIARLDNCGDTFGELSVIDGEARSASIITVADTVCLAIDGSFLDRVNPDQRNAVYAVFYRLLSEILSDRLRTTSTELVKVREELEKLKKG